MRRVLPLFIALGSLGIFVFALNAQSSAQVTMENGTSQALDLYVAGSYGCRALKGMFCTTQAAPGTNIKLEAKSGDKVIDHSTIAELKAGASHNWKATE